MVRFVIRESYFYLLKVPQWTGLHSEQGFIVNRVLRGRDHCCHSNLVPPKNLDWRSAVCKCSANIDIEYSYLIRTVQFFYSKWLIVQIMKHVQKSWKSKCCVFHFLFGHQYYHYNIFLQKGTQLLSKDL